jgi:hypothetical protein
MGLVIYVPSALLSREPALSLLAAVGVYGILTFPADPAGIYSPSTPINRGRHWDGSKPLKKCPFFQN